MSTRPLLLVGGVGQLLRGDLDLGRLAAEQLAGEIDHPAVVVEDLSYGAIRVAQRLEELRPGAMVLIGAVERGRAPGSMITRRVEHRTFTPEQFQAAVVDTGTGYVGVDLLIDVADGLGVLPDDTVVIEVEPAETWPTGKLTPPAASGLALALQAARAEIDRVVRASSPSSGAGARGDDRAVPPEGEETTEPGAELGAEIDGEWIDLVSRLLPPPGPTTETWEQLGADLSDLPPGETRQAGGGTNAGQ